jgi:hypothetical protein
MTNRTKNILTVAFVLAVAIFGAWVLVRGGADEDRTLASRARMDLIRDIRTTFGQHVTEGVFWKDERGNLKLWRDLERDDEFLEFTGTGTVFTICPSASCDDIPSCTEKLEEACSNAGHCGVDDDSVTITRHADYSKTCSGECTCQNGVGCGDSCPIAFEICGPLT